MGSYNLLRGLKMSDNFPAVVEKGHIKLTEYHDSTYNYEDKLFLQCTCVGFYLTPQELKDLYTVVGYYLNADDITDVKVSIGGEDVAL
jgi:hypothetical protein